MGDEEEAAAYGDCVLGEGYGERRQAAVGDEIVTHTVCAESTDDSSYCSRESGA